MITKNDHGFYVRDNHASDQKAFEEVVLKRGYERRDFKVEQGEVWLDIGAHIGSFAAYAARRGARVHAYEPDPETYAVLLKNIEGKENVKSFNYGLGDKEGEFVFYRNDKRGNTWRNNFKRPWQGGSQINAQMKNVADENIINTDIPLNLKIDAEGSELEILRTLEAKSLLRRFNKIALEWTFDVNTLTADFLGTLATLESEGFKILTPTRNYRDKLKVHKYYPKSWFPPATKVFAIKREI